MKIFKVGCGLFFFGVILFFISIFLFTYQGDLFPGITKVGEIALVIWLPMIVIGLILMMLKSKEKNKI